MHGLLGWVEKKKQAAQVPLNRTGKPWNWLTGMMMVVVAVLGIALLAWRAWQRGKEIAKLRHKLDVDKASEHQAEVNAKLASNAEEREALQEQAKNIKERIEKTQIEIIRLETERRSSHLEINKATKWEDVDKIIDELYESRIRED